MAEKIVVGEKEIELPDTVSVLEIDGTQMVTVADAMEISELSRAYINRLLNTGQIKGRNIGLGWMVEVESLVSFESTSRRAPGKQRLLDNALQAFLEQHGLDEQWTIVRNAVLTEYEASRKAAKEAAAAAEEAEE